MEPITGATNKSIEDHIKLRATLEKKWDDCTTEEKLEKIRAELRDFRYLTNRVCNVEGHIERLKEHSHQDGKIVIPLKELEKHSGLAGLAQRTDYLS